MWVSFTATLTGFPTIGSPLSLAEGPWQVSELLSKDRSKRASLGYVMKSCPKKSRNSWNVQRIII